MAAALHTGLDDYFVIDLATQTIFPVSEVPDHAPRKHGRKLHIATVYRHLNGVRARDGSLVPLPSIQYGGTRYTSIEAMQWFAERLGRRAGELTPAANRCKSAELAARELDAIGIR